MPGSHEPETLAAKYERERAVLAQRLRLAEVQAEIARLEQELAAARELERRLADEIGNAPSDASSTA